MEKRTLLSQKHVIDDCCLAKSLICQMSATHFWQINGFIQNLRGRNIHRDSQNSVLIMTKLLPDIDKFLKIFRLDTVWNLNANMKIQTELCCYLHFSPFIVKAEQQNSLKAPKIKCNINVFSYTAVSNTGHSLIKTSVKLLPLN